MLKKILDKFSAIIGTAAERVPGSSNLHHTVGQDGYPSPDAGIDIVKARRDEASAEGLPSFVLPGVNRPLPSLEELSESAWSILESEFDRNEEWLGIVKELSPVEKVQVLYSVHLSSWFSKAICELTGWPIVGVIGIDGEDRRFANMHPNGKLVDATGFISDEEIHEIEHEPEFKMVHYAGMSHQGRDDTMADVMAAITYFNELPFPSLWADASLWASRGSLRPWAP
jgi:hypothetical protein